jgi:protein gp37
MAEVTGISWTDHTHNEWWGCSSTAGAGCDKCYAAVLDRRTGGNYFGIGTSPRRTKEQNRNKPYRWNRDAEASGKRLRVFCGSMMDFFDKNAPQGAREALWSKIKETVHLDWQVLTKRPSNITKMLPADWGNGYANVWLGATCEDRKSGLRRLEQLREIPAKVRFLSVEPLLEDLGEINLEGIQWCIVGGESGGGFRAMEKAWADRVIAQCREQGVAVFFKQWGGTASDAGGCLIDGREIKEWPKVA